MGVFSIESFYALDPIAFEDTAKSLLIQMGFDATTTKASGDGGVDIVAMNEQPIISGKYVIQCKRYAIGNNVGEPAVRELYGVMHSENANKGILITTADFTTQARAFAANKAIELINGHALLALCNKYLADVEDNSLLIARTQLESSAARVKKTLADFDLEIEKEEIRTSKQSLDLIAYAKLTNPGTPFRNEFLNIIDFSEKIDKIFSDIHAALKNSAYSETDDEIRAFFVANMDNAIKNPANTALFSLLNEYCSKSLSLLHTLIGIAPPPVAAAMHSSFVDIVKRLLKLFTILMSYAKTANDIDKLMYIEFAMKAHVEAYAAMVQFPAIMVAFKEQAEADIQKKPSGGCFVATAVYGDPLCTEVLVLRSWRDDFLSRRALGRQFIRFYYAVGPIAANHLSKYFLLKTLLRNLMDRFVRSLRKRWASNGSAYY